ncbi:hypothetical protein [Micromonospora trifolii]|uniref:hypothetical protein n=1 Tax=Micromonospora trifolii TaxID=2911208 RepID=UPI003CEACE0A
MNRQNLTTEKVHAWPRALAVAALLTSTLTAGWSHLAQGDVSGVWVGWLPAVMTAIPLFTVRRKPFEYACLAAGVLVLCLAVVGVPLVMIFPAALILLAAVADPRRAPRRARVSVLVGVLLAIVAGVVLAGGIYPALTSPPVGFIVHTNSEFTVTEPTFERVVERVVQRAPTGYGVEGGVRVDAAGDDEGPTITIQFRSNLPADGQERLRRHLAEVPGVTKVCSWYRDNHLRSRC